MAYKGGKWTTTDDSILPGARINVIAKERATSILSPRGIAAIPMELDWGAEDDIIAYTRRDYVRDALYNFGYNYKDPHLRDLDEVFQGATEIRIGRINAGGEKATFDLGEAKWSGIRGNDFVVTVEAEADSGYVDNPLYPVKVDFISDRYTVYADFSNVPRGYTPSGSVLFNGEEVNTTAILVEEKEDQVTYTFGTSVTPGTYTLKASLKIGSTNYLISTDEVEVTVDPETHRTITITKGEETVGDVEKVTISKYGFVKTKAELDTAVGAGMSSQIDHDNNVFYIVFATKPEDVNTYLAQFEVDGKTYATSLTYANNFIGLGKGASHNTDVDFVKDGSTWKDHDKSEIDVTGKTVNFSIVKYNKEATLETIKANTPKTIIEPVEIDCTASVPKESVTVNISDLKVTYTVKTDQIQAKVTGRTEEYDLRYTIKNDSDVVIAEIPGRLWVEQRGDTLILNAAPDAGDQSLKFEISVIKQQKGAKKQVISTLAFTTMVEGEDKPETVELTDGTVKPTNFDRQIPARFIVRTFLDDVEVNKQKVKGMYQLRDSDFIIWNREKELELTAGMKLEGGTNGPVTVERYSDILNKLEVENFHCLGWPIVDEELQQMAINFTIKMRDEMGIKFQTVMPKTLQPPNYEGVIQIENSVKDKDVKDREAALTYWVTGQEAGCKVQDSVANMMYTGAYTIDVDYSQRDLENLCENGYFVFHLARGIDAKQYIKTLLDINTLVEPDETQNDDWKRNQTIRVMDQCCNDVAAIFNNNYFGKVPNTQTGREQLQNDIINHHLELEKIQAIEDFDPEAVIVERGDNKVTVLAQDAITPVNAMERLYMTIVII